MEERRTYRRACLEIGVVGQHVVRAEILFLDEGAHPTGDVHTPRHKIVPEPQRRRMVVVAPVDTRSRGEPATKECRPHCMPFDHFLVEYRGRILRIGAP